MTKRLHLFASLIATFCIATFFSSTLIVELFGSQHAIAKVKALIVMPGLFILVPAIALTGAMGFMLAKGRQGRLVASKKRRMPFIAANGLLILVPAAIYLNHWAALGQFDTKFYILQFIELLAGAVNLTLMLRSAKEGLTMSGRLRPKK